MGKPSRIYGKSDRMGGSPVNFRTINISAAPRESNGHYIPDLSLKAIIYSSSGIKIGTVDLSGKGPYYGNFTYLITFQENGDI